MQRWMSWPAKVPPEAVAMAFGFAAAIGVFFGFYPAQKAARLEAPLHHRPQRIVHESIFQSIEKH
jgi:hypothetical protein